MSEIAYILLENTMVNFVYTRKKRQNLPFFEYQELAGHTTALYFI